MLKIHTEVLASGLELYFVPSEFLANLDPKNSEEDFKTLGIACRLNTMSMIKAAGSGHIGSSFSAIDLIIASRIFHESRSTDIFFSSKGHDAPGLYSVMNALGEVPDEMLLKLRRMAGLPGHPEVGLFGIPTSTGSLGMGISKAKGFWYAKENANSKITVLLGDGELQEGQIWESLPGASRDKMGGLLAIVDGNKIQSDTWVEMTLPLGDLQKRVEGSGWRYLECDGHEYASLKKTFDEISLETSKPVFLYAHTKKSSGVSFMEDFDPEGLFYKYHSGSPSDKEYAEAAKELILKLNLELPLSLFPNSPTMDDARIRSSNDFLPKERNRSLIQSWAEILEEIFSSDLKFVALDADLSYDTGTYKIAQSFKSRYIQCGIAEQDMVSVAGSLALSGKVPIVHSFASFLTTRAAEQIFNNLSEQSKIVYCGFLAGILPSAPGHSHQAVSDFGIISSFPNIEIFEPACETELRLMKKFIYETDKSIYLRIGSVDLPQPAPTDSVSLGRLTPRKIGSKFAIITSGPSMTKIALEAADLVEGGLVSVFTYPTPGRQLSEGDLSNLSEFEKIVVLENHLPALGIFQNLSKASISEHLSVTRIGISELPRNGRTDEVLNFHGMDAASIKQELLS